MNMKMTKKTKKKMTKKTTKKIKMSQVKIELEMERKPFQLSTFRSYRS